jgi:ABC-2 type transport system ATP-binding protein
MTAQQDIVVAEGLGKRYGRQQVLHDVDFRIGVGRIVGLIGPNGAGKSTILRAITGMISHSGQLEVLGLDPRRQRAELMRRMAFIADVAILPRWLRVDRAIGFLAGTHPHFRSERALEFLRGTDIKLKSRIQNLSKGMVTQLHLALVMAMDARLLVLDEPTLGLDIIYRKTFYEQLINDYFDGNRTILVTTHQVEEIEHMLTDVLFVRDGRIRLDASVDDLAQRFVEVQVDQSRINEARALRPLSERSDFGRTLMLFEDADAERLAGFGSTRTPRLADLFVATMKESAA